MISFQQASVSESTFLSCYTYTLIYTIYAYRLYTHYIHMAYLRTYIPISSYCSFLVYTVLVSSLYSLYILHNPEYSYYLYSTILILYGTICVLFILYGSSCISINSTHITSTAPFKPPALSEAGFPLETWPWPSLPKPVDVVGPVENF